MMPLEDLFSIKTWLTFISVYFFILFVVFCVICVRDMVDIISEKLCRQLLLDQNTTFTFKSFEVKPLEEETRGGLIGLHYILRINYERENELQTLQLFVKTLNNQSEIMFKLSRDLLFYEKEKLFFMKLLPEFKNAGISVSFAPHGYLCAGTAVVLEELTLAGFKLFPKEESLDIEHCHACLSVLADFHASSLLYEICKSKSSGKKYNLPEEHSDILKDLIYSGGDTYGTKYVETSVEGLIALAELEFDDNVTLDQLKNIFNSSDSPNYDGLCCVLLHGDLWTNNFLHRYDKNKIIESKLIDFQTIKYGPPCLDVLQLIYSNTRKSLRDEHSNDLLCFYYQKLDEIFKDRSLDIGDYLPRKQFFQSCDMFKLRIKLQAAIDRSLTCIPDQALRKIEADQEKFTNFLFDNRAKYLVGYYANIPTYKELVSEDLKELRDMLHNMK